MVLWEKESSISEVYVDLIGPTAFATTYQQIFSAVNVTQKSDRTSNELRMLGNAEFKLKKWPDAMEYYNQSLRHACHGSETISLAYANRSSCFLRMGLFEQCLIDIDMAKAANYPPQLMYKLIEREAICAKHINESKQIEKSPEPVLDFDGNRRFPGLANVVQIRNNDEFGTHLMATDDIDMGKIILIDEAFVFDASQCKKSYCKNCLKFTKCFIPCEHCTDVMFCDHECMAAAATIHDLACGTLYHRFPDVTSTIESILIAVNAFADAKELIEFVEAALATRDYNTPICDYDSVMQSKYKLFLKSFTIVNDKPNFMRRFHFCEIYQLIMLIPRAKQYFDTMKTQRFLMHLIWQHYFIIQTNSFAFNLTTVRADDIQIMGSISSLFNHSCVPNIMLAKYAKKTLAYAVLPIEKGQQLFIKYDNRPNTQEQQAMLQDQFHFTCKCSKCKPCYKQEDRERMQLDRNFEVIVQANDDWIANQELRSKLRTMCCEFFEKFGKLPWSPEIDIVSNALRHCMRADFNSKQF